MIHFNEFEQAGYSKEESDELMALCEMYNIEPIIILSVLRATSEKDEEILEQLRQYSMTPWERALQNISKALNDTFKDIAGHFTDCREAIAETVDRIRRG